jgi:phosphoribosylaminoimidazole-succinocarboxamide synthase
MGELLYEGKAKQLFTTDQPQVLLVKYKDSATAFNGEKKATLAGKGELNNKIASHFFRLLTENKIPNHFIDIISPLEQLVKQVTIIPLEVVVRNVAAGSFSKRLGIEEGRQLRYPIVEFYYKDDSLGDPLVTEDHVYLLSLADDEEVEQMKEQALDINHILSTYMEDRGIRLVDFKLEFGLDKDGQLILADEISPDTCRFWDLKSGDKLDKDRFRRDLGNVLEAYQEIYQRLGGGQHV